MCTYEMYKQVIILLRSSQFWKFWFTALKHFITKYISHELYSMPQYFHWNKIQTTHTHTHKQNIYCQGYRLTDQMRWGELWVHPGALITNITQYPNTNIHFTTTTAHLKMHTENTISSLNLLQSWRLMLALYVLKTPGLLCTIHFSTPGVLCFLGTVKCLHFDLCTFQ